MKLELGRRADYAIRAAVDLAGHAGPELRKARSIADAMQIPVTYVAQILAALVRAGVAESVAGRFGGYELARQPTDISLLDVVHAVEGDILSAACVLRGGPCRWEGMCAVHVPWVRAQQALLDSLAATSLADLVEIDEALERGTYQPPADARRPLPGAALAG